jgi:hypothetical protein
LGLRGGGAELGEEWFGIGGLNGEFPTGLGEDVHDGAVAPSVAKFVGRNLTSILKTDFSDRAKKEISSQKSVGKAVKACRSANQENQPQS